MNTRVFYITLITFVFSTVKNEPILSDDIIELTPLLIPCGLHDIIVISAPIITNDTKYFLYTPKGKMRFLDLKPQYATTEKCSKETEEYRIFKHHEDTSKGFHINEGFIDRNDFIIGPLDYKDHGNWVLSAYYQKNGKLIEAFQVISIEIVEIVEAMPKRQTVNLGEHLEIRFASPIDNIESCEIVPPESTFDRLYDRSSKSCGFLIPNVTNEDSGIWQIIGVGRIVYKAFSIISVENKCL